VASCCGPRPHGRRGVPLRQRRVANVHASRVHISFASAAARASGLCRPGFSDGPVARGVGLESACAAGLRGFHFPSCVSALDSRARQRSAICSICSGHSVPSPTCARAAAAVDPAKCPPSRLCVSEPGGRCAAVLCGFLASRSCVRRRCRTVFGCVVSRFGTVRPCLRVLPTRVCGCPAALTDARCRV
jgi:hypothetical protein